MSKSLKLTFFTALLMGVGYFFGTICRQINKSCGLIFTPSVELVYLMLWLLAALCAMVVAAGLVAALLRPMRVAILAFVLSGVSMLLGWQVSVGSSILILIYLIATSFYVSNIAQALNERVRFSIRPISESKGILLMVLVLVACGSLYFGCSTHIEREGFVIPEYYIQLFAETMREQVLAQAPEEEREQTAAEFEEQFQGMIDNFEDTLKPYEQYIPLAIAVSFIFPLITVTNLLAVIPTVVLSLIFHLLTALGITKVVSETREVQRLIVE